MRHARITLVVLALMACFLSGRPWASRSRAQETSTEELFESKIRPILVGTCFRCHGGEKISGSLRVDSLQSLLKGGESGSAIVPGNPADSLLIRALERADGVSAMPPDKDAALRADQIADFREWVKRGALWPEKSTAFASSRHWSYEPIRDPRIPQTEDASWVKTSIDAFVYARQQEASLRPAPAADKLTLLRRMTFDLTGLPPTPEELNAFLADQSESAVHTVIERLLSSPAYGEHWARHWLDIVRYADTAGETADYPVPNAWRYRNFVIDSFQHDKPYNEFIREQLAGDILANQGPREQVAERITATGFLAISRRFGFDSENYHHLTIQDTIDTIGQSILGLSLGCARCHDHKYDPVSMKDYYGLYGIFESSRYSFPGSEQKQKFRAMVPLLTARESQEAWQAYEQRVAALAGALAGNNSPSAPAILRSLHDMDGDFELQAPAAGGSKGVLVPPWLESGMISVTTAAQSPFRNLHPMGKVGASVAAQHESYRIAQSLPVSWNAEKAGTLFVNLDFRIGTTGENTLGSHRLQLTSLQGGVCCEVWISAKEISVQRGDHREAIAAVTPGEWQNIQLVLDLRGRTFSGRVGTPGKLVEFNQVPCGANWNGTIDSVALDGLAPADGNYPAIEFDNLGVQDRTIPLVSTAAPRVESLTNGQSRESIESQLQALAAEDGDLELQAEATPPASPWNAGPNSVVKVTKEGQSPYQNLYPAGQLGLAMPNRGEYDGFGMAIPMAPLGEDGKLHVSFDVQCASDAAGGDGSWRYYLGQGPGNSAAVELFFNAKEFFRRSGDERTAIAHLKVGEWYQVQFVVDTKARTYSGSISSPQGGVKFDGNLASGWNGKIDYTFIDSYGHLPGVRPALRADNFRLQDHELPPFGGAPVEDNLAGQHDKRAKVAALRGELEMLNSKMDDIRNDLNRLLVDGPFPMAYGVTEGTPHNCRLQKRGEPDQVGEEVPRGLIGFLGGRAFPAETTGSGRLELADWLTRPDNPLTARVMVNRIWQFHFGRGLVRTPNDFGARGMPPTDPDLLDHLATQFIRQGWSIKAMHRLILSSATYQQSGRESIMPLGQAPEEELASRYVGFERRRLSAEEVRDSILAVSGELDASRGEGHPFPSPIGWGYTQHGPFSAVYDHKRRSIYLMTQRLKRHPFLALFDGPDPNATVPIRLTTTVPTQALFFMNDPFVHENAKAWAERLVGEVNDERQWVDRAYQRALGRHPDTVEMESALSFMTAYREELQRQSQPAAPADCLAPLLRTLFSSNEFLHVE